MHMENPTPQPQQRILLSKKEAAYLLSISLRKLDYLIAQRQLVVRKIGTKVLIPRTALVDFSKGDH
jgi:excisionase family DNA binding protein